MSLFTNPKFLIPVIYGSILMLFFLWVTMALIINRKTLRSSFYSLFIVGFFMNFLTYLNSYISLRLPQNTGVNGTLSDFFLSHNAYEHGYKCPIYLFHTLHYQFAYAQYIFNCFICLNRFTLIFWPLNSEKLWRRYFWLIVIAIFGTPSLVTFRIFGKFSFYRYSASGDYFWIDSSYGRKNIYMWLTLFLVLITILNIVFNLGSYWQMRKARRAGLNVPEKSLLRMSFCVFFIDIFLTILAILNAALTILNPECPDWTILAEWVSKLTPFASDALTFSHPILLFGFSKTVRRKCIELVPYLRNFRRHPYFANSKSVAFVIRGE